MSPPSADPVPPNEAVARFPGLSLAEVSRFEGVTENGETIYFRKGTPKPKGLQVTIRTGEPFGIDVAGGKGRLCVNRGSCWMIPHAVLRQWLGDKLQQQTVDVYLDVNKQVLTAGGVPPLPIEAYVGSAPTGIE